MVTQAECIAALKRQFPNYSNYVNEVALLLPSPEALAGEYVQAFIVANNIYDQITPLLDYIDLFRRQYPEERIDALYLAIFQCVERQFQQQCPELRVSRGIALARQMWPHLDQVRASGEASLDDALTISVVGYLCLYRLPEIITIDRIKEIREQIAPYIAGERKSAEIQMRHMTVEGGRRDVEVGRKMQRFISTLSIEKLRICLWILEAHPDFPKDEDNLPTAEVRRWAQDIASSTLYTRVNRQYGSDCPFSCISVETHVGGKVEISAWSRVYLSGPDLFAGFQHWSAVSAFENSSRVSLAFHVDDMPMDTVCGNITTFFNILFSMLSVEADRVAVVRNYKEVLNEIAIFAKNRTPLKYLQRHMPNLLAPIGDVVPDSQAMVDDIKAHNVVALRKRLREGESPNRQWHGLPVPMVVLKLLPKYQFYLLRGEVTVRILDRVKKDYHILIAQGRSGQYDIHYFDPSKAHFISKSIRKENSLLSAVDALFSKEVTEEGRCVAYPTYKQESEILMQVVEPYLADDLQRWRRAEADKVRQVVRLMLDYDMDPAIRGDVTHPGTKTAVEELIARTDIEYTLDSVNRRLLHDLLRLSLLLDGNRSYCYVSKRKYHDTPLGQLLVEAKSIVSQTKALPKKLIEIAQRYSRNTINVSNIKGERVCVQMVSLHAFIHLPARLREGVLALARTVFCNDTFPWQGKSQAAFDAYIIKKMQPKADLDCIDIVTNAAGDVIGFNICNIVMPNKFGDPIYHLVQLAAALPSLGKSYPKLMSILSFQRTFFLAKMFPASEVMTIYTAASPKSYTQVKGLRSYPHHDCIPRTHLDTIHDRFFAPRERLEQNGVTQYKSDLFYPVRSAPPQVFKQSDIAREEYEAHIERSGCSTLVTFSAIPDNLNSLAQKMGFDGVSDADVFDAVNMASFKPSML